MLSYRNLRNLIQKFDSRIDGKNTASFSQKGASYYAKHKDK